jgi:hypothetical protein
VHFSTLLNKTMSNQKREYKVLIWQIILLVNIGMIHFEGQLYLNHVDSAHIQFSTLKGTYLYLTYAKVTQYTLITQRNMTSGLSSIIDSLVPRVVQCNKCLLD